MGQSLVPGGKILVLDTEYNSAKKYAGGKPYRFYHINVDHNTDDPLKFLKDYIRLIREAGKSGIDVLILDSISHAWHAVLDYATREAKGKPFGGWDKATPVQRELIEAILSSNCHIIATARSKSDYSVDKDEKGKTTVTKVGTKPEQRENVEYEFDIAGDMDKDNVLTITKTRCSELNHKRFHQPGKELAEILSTWLNEGDAPEAPKSVPSADTQKTTPASAPTAASSTATPDGTIADPKPAPGASEKKPDDDAPASATANAGEATGQDTKDAPVGKEQMAQLLHVGDQNKWSKTDINAELKKALNGNKVITWKVWEAVLKVVSEPKKETANAK